MSSYGIIPYLSLDNGFYEIKGESYISQQLPNYKNVNHNLDIVYRTVFANKAPEFSIYKELDDQYIVWQMCIDNDFLFNTGINAASYLWSIHHKKNICYKLIPDIDYNRQLVLALDADINIKRLELILDLLNIIATRNIHRYVKHKKIYDDLIGYELLNCISSKNINGVYAILNYFSAIEENQSLFAEPVYFNSKDNTPNDNISIYDKIRLYNSINNNNETVYDIDENNIIINNIYAIDLYYVKAYIFIDGQWSYVPEGIHKPIFVTCREEIKKWQARKQLEGVDIQIQNNKIKEIFKKI